MNKYAVGLSVLLVPLISGSGWTHYAGDSARSAQVLVGPAGFEEPLWMHPPQAGEKFGPLSTPVSFNGRVYLNVRRFNGSLQIGNALAAVDARSGARLWTTPIQADTLDSWSSAAVDARNNQVLIPAGDRLYSVHAQTGAILWSTLLSQPVVNASAAITFDRTTGGVPANRAFITGFSDGVPGVLYAINIDPFHAAHNPFMPGEIAWMADLPITVGASPAYSDGLVVVAGYTSPFPPFQGQVRAFNAASGQLAWQRDVGGDDGFFGGVTVTTESVYAATYDFDLLDPANNSRLLKLRRVDGTISWSVPCERSSSVPVVTPLGRIYIASGIDGFGSNPRVQAFQDLGGFAIPLWDTWADTGGTLRIGGWLHTPAFANGRLYVGVPGPPAQSFSAYAELMIIDPTLSPTDPNFISAALAGPGGSPGILCGDLHSIGQAGLFAFGLPPECARDLDLNGVVNQVDLNLLLANFSSGIGGSNYNPASDLDCSGAIDQDDLNLLLGAYLQNCAD